MNFEQLPKQARLKIFHTNRPLTEEESQVLLKEVDLFMESWKSHKKEISAAREWKYNQFLLIGVDESKVSLSGCSIDSMSHLAERVGRTLGVKFLNSPPICYRDPENNIQCVERMDFKKVVQAGQATENTIVFNNIIQSMEEYLAGKWELPLKESWHARAFPIPQPS